MTDIKLSVAKVISSTSVDGVGLRNSLYVAGCPFRCLGCHNMEWWNIQKGTWRPIEDVYEELNRDKFNISILGGEPLLQYQAVTELCRLIKARTGKTIWLWTGYTYENVEKYFPDILEYVDVLVDGRFKQDLASPKLKWRGSSNQRVIDVRSTRQEKEIKILCA